jgi:hypothetical protein
VQNCSLLTRVGSNDAISLNGIAIADLSGIVERYNPTLCALLRCSETELRSINFAMLIPSQGPGLLALKQHSLSLRRTAAREAGDGPATNPRLRQRNTK